MPRNHISSANDREFFQWVADAAFANPFSEQRHELDLKIAGDFKTEEERGRFLKNAVSQQVGKLEADGRAHLRFYSGEERERMRTVFLFEAYHEIYERLDEVIAAQLKSGDTPVRVNFAGDTVSLLERRGCTGSDAVRFFGVFFQLRRAFHFIHHGLIGGSDCMKTLRRQLWDNIFTHDIRCYDQHLWNRMEDFSTVLLGETGAGKGASAAAIGQSGFIPFEERRSCFSVSFTRGFIALNLSQFPETLIESELFGHKKGAFTGAVEAHEGVLARCSPYGAILLDEIGDVSAPVQIKLLQVLQERTFSPVGSHEKQRFRGRVIAATNQSLDLLRERKLFRDDFFYRLCSDIITVPTLRQRIRECPAELDDLVRHLVLRMAGEASASLAGQVLEVLNDSVGGDYAWPGNVRELEQAVRRILLRRHYDGDVRGTAPDLRGRLIAGLDGGSIDADTLLSGYCVLLHERHGTIEEVARRTSLDRRTVKRYLEMGRAK